MATKKLQILGGNAEFNNLIKELTKEIVPNGASTYDPNSDSAPSGKAVSEAIASAIEDVDSEIDSKIQTAMENVYTKEQVDAKIASGGGSGSTGGGFIVSSSAPSDTNVLWIDTNSGLKYHNGTDWVPVPVLYG